MRKQKAMPRMTHFLRRKTSNRALELGVLGNFSVLPSRFHFLYIVFPTPNSVWSTPAFSFLRAVLEFSISLPLVSLNSVPSASFAPHCAQFQIVTSLTDHS